MLDGFSAGGIPTEQSLQYFRVRAEGGVGLIIVGNIHIDPTHRHISPEFYLFDDSYIEKIRPLVDIVHQGGAKVFAQLIHQGRYAKSTDYFDRIQAVAPSAIPTRFTGETPRELTVKEIEDLTDYFAQGARRAAAASFDGVELCGNSGYLIGQFLSPLTNLRKDRYGGSLKGRMAFVLEIMAAIRRQVGSDFPVTVRIGGNDFVPGSNTNVEACQIAAALSEGGADAISVTGGWHESRVPQVTMDLPHGSFSYLGRMIKQAVTVPVMMSNRMNIPKGEALVEHGEVDFIVLGRPMLADPDAPRKAEQGRYDEIRPCIGCNQGCLDHSMSGQSIACLGNAECGRENELMDGKGRLPTQVKTSEPKRVLVVGAGVAGMEFSRVAALRGHQVTVWEEENSSGGQMEVASTPPGRHDFALLSDYLAAACRRAGVKFKFAKKATAETVLKAYNEKHFDCVVLATGAVPIVPRIPTEEGAHVVQAWDVLRNREDTGKKVVVVGGGAVGVETAIFLGEIDTMDPEVIRFLLMYDAETPETLRYHLNHGSKQITVVEMLPSIGKDIGKTTRWIMLGRLKSMGITARTGCKVVEIKKDGVAIEGPEGTAMIPADTVILAIGSRAKNELYAELKDKIESIFVIGDAETPRKAMDAIKAGYNFAFSLSKE